MCICVGCLLSSCMCSEGFICRFGEKILIGFFALAAPKEGHKSLKKSGSLAHVFKLKTKKRRTPPAGCSAQVTLRLWAVGEKGARLGSSGKAAKPTRRSNTISMRLPTRWFFSFLFFQHVFGNYVCWQYASSRRRLQPTTDAKVVAHIVSHRR